MLDDHLRRRHSGDFPIQHVFPVVGTGVQIKPEELTV